MGITTGASLLAGQMFGSVDEIMDKDGRANISADSIGHVSTSHNIPSDVNHINISNNQKSIADTIREFFLKQPAVLKSAFLVPLWAVGHFILYIINTFAKLYSPVWDWIIGFAVQFALLFSVFLIIYKFLFPNSSVKEIVSGGRWKWFLAASLVLVITDRVLLAYVKDYQWIRVLLIVLAAFLVIFMLCSIIFKGKRTSETGKSYIYIPKVDK